MTNPKTRNRAMKFNIKFNKFAFRRKSIFLEKPQIQDKRIFSKSKQRGESSRFIKQVEVCCGNISIKTKHDNVFLDNRTFHSEIVSHLISELWNFRRNSNGCCYKIIACACKFPLFWRGKTAAVEGTIKILRENLNFWPPLNSNPGLRISSRAFEKPTMTKSNAHLWPVSYKRWAHF